MAELAGLQHELATDPVAGEQLAALDTTNLTPEESAAVRELRADYQQATALGVAFATKLGHATSRGQQQWTAARAERSFEKFLPALSEIIMLKQEEGLRRAKQGQTPYDALLNLFEAGLTATDFQGIVTPIVTELSPVVQSVKQGSGNQLEGVYPSDRQKLLAEHVVRQLGYPAEYGRTDLSAHPFSTTIHAHDSRITIRMAEGDIWNCLGAAIHETGHALYELGLPQDKIISPLGQAASTAVHESQSRLYENLVGRSVPFWQWLQPEIQQQFPGSAYATQTPEAIVRALNTVTADPIRVVSDEVTYPLHIALRFELEQQLIAGTLRPDQLRDAWNDRFTQLFGYAPKDDAEGVLQDIHWSMGAFGYFPTYLLGTIYSSELWSVIQHQLSSWESDWSAGNFEPLLKWLREHIHQYGRQFAPRALIEQTIGRKVSSQAFLDHLIHDYRLR
jgi:carboxypeptidase Taq